MSTSTHDSQQQQRQYWDASNPQLPPAPQPPYTNNGLTPYLTLPHHLSLTWIATPILSLLFVVFRLFSSISDAQDSGDGAKRVLLSSCNSAQTAATVAASLPRYMAEGTNAGIEKAVNDAIDAARATMIFSLTALEGIIEFIIDIYRSTFLCFLELAVRGTLSVLISATQEFSTFVTGSLNSLRTSIQGDIASANNVIQSAVSAVNNVIPSFLNIQLSVPTFDIPSLSGLQNVTLPTTFQDSLTKLNSTIPTLDDVRQSLDNLIEAPFNALKQELNDSFSTIRFDKSVLPVPATQQLSFCNDLDTSVVDELIHDLIKVARIGCFLLLGVAILMIIGNCFVQWYRWRSLKLTLDRVREEETTTITGAGPMMELSDRNLLSVASSIENPFASRVAYIMTRMFRLSPQKNINIRFFFNYIFYAPALACFLIGFFGLISVQLQLVAIHPIQQHYSAQVATQVNSFAQTITDGVNGDMLAQSTAYANSVNAQIDTLQTSVNEGVFGWVNGTIVPLNNTIEAFYQDIQNAVQTVFGGTILEAPMQEFVRCLIGTKVEALENAFTFVQENFQVNVPRVEPTVLMLSNQTVQEATTPIALAAVGGESNGNDGGIVGNLVNRYVAALEKERLMFLIFLGLWMLVVLMGIGIIFWHSYAKTWMYRFNKKRFNRGRKEIVAGEGVITPWVDSTTRRAGGKESPFKRDEKGLIDWDAPLMDNATPSNGPTTTASGLPKSYLVSEPVTTYSNIAIGRPAKGPNDLRPVIRLDSPTPSSTHQRNESASSQGSTEGLLRKKSGKKLTANGRRPIRETLITDGLDTRGFNTGLSPNGASNEDDSPSRTSDGGFLTKLGGIFGPTSAVESDEQEHSLRPPLPTMGTFGQASSPVDNGVAPQPQRVQLMEGEKRKSVHAKQGGARTPTSQIPPPPGLGNANPFWSPNAPQSVSGTSFLSSSPDADSPVNNRQSGIPIHHGFLYDSRMRVPAVPQLPKPLAPQPSQNGGTSVGRNPSQSHSRSLSGGPRQLFPGGPQHSRKSSLIDPALANIAGIGTRQLDTIPGTPNMGQQQADPFTSPYDDRRTSRAQRGSNPFADRYPSVY